MPETGKPDEKIRGKEIRISAEIEKFAAALAKDPKSRAFAPLAEAYRRAGMLDEAIMVAQDGLKIHPAYHSGRVALGRAYFDKEMLAESAQELETVTKSSPDNIIAQKVLGEIYFRQGEKEKAKRLFSLVLTLSPGDKEAEERIKALTQPSPPPEPEKPSDRSDQSDSSDLVPEPKPASVPEPVPVPVTAEEPKPETSEPKAEPEKSSGRSDQIDLSDLVPEPQPASVPEPVTEPVSEPEPEMASKPEPASIPEPVSEPEPEIDLEPESETALEPQTSSIPEPLPEPELEKPSDRSDQSDSSDLVPGPQPSSLDEFPSHEDETDGDSIQSAETGGEAIATPTIAEIYVKQGHLEKALEVYREILAADPGAREIVQRVVELSRLLPRGGKTEAEPPVIGGRPTPTERKILALKGWLGNIQRIRGEKH